MKIPSVALPSDSKRLPHVTTHSRATSLLPISLPSLLFLALYVVLGVWVVGTIGHPYREYPRHAV